MINYTESNKPQRNNSALVIGLILVIVGSVIVLFNLDMISWKIKNLLISWQMLLIVIGLFQLNKKNVMPGVIILLIGVFFMIPKLNALYPNIFPFIPNFSAIFWPLILVIAGIIIISKSVFNQDKNREYSHEGHRKQRPYRNEQSDGTINENYIFSGSDQIFLDPVFKGGKIQAIFGGMTLDLRRTTLPEGVSVLKIEAIFGGVDIIVPESWDVKVVQNSFLGGFSDKRHGAILLEENKKLIIEATCVFGGGEVK